MFTVQRCGVATTLKHIVENLSGAHEVLRTVVAGVLMRQHTLDITRDGAVWKLAGLIIQRSQVQILFPLFEIFYFSFFSFYLLCGWLGEISQPSGLENQLGYNWV